jgi:acetyl esterase/lipase
MSTASKLLSSAALALVAAFLIPSQISAQRRGPEPEVVRLWESTAPGAKGDADEDIPTLGLYPANPDRSTGAAIVVCPGGGYRNLAMDHEGDQVARWLNSFGVSAFVLKYRLGPKYNHPVELGDAQRALRYVRHNAAKFQIDPNRVGIMGFSAGGHLASTAATPFDKSNPSASDPLDRHPSRPDFAVLGYPVISYTTEYTHQGSKGNLLGENPDPKLVELLSNELQVTAETPPTFLFHTNEDTGVPPENSVLFYMALRKAGVPAELHIYERGRHGVGLAPTDKVLSSWPARLADWMYGRGLLTK